MPGDKSAPKKKSLSLRRSLENIKYNKLTQNAAGKATRGRLDKIRTMFKEFAISRPGRSVEKVGQLPKVTSQPMGAEREMYMIGGDKPGKQKKETLPLERYSYYHGCLPRADTEEILMPYLAGHFLVRASQRKKDSFAVVLSIRTQSSVAHYELPVDESGKFYFNEFSFETVHDLLFFHWKYKVPISLLNESELYLVKAVDRPDWLFDDNEVTLEPVPLGEGNFGAVYRASAVIHGKTVQLAVKTLQNPDDKVGREELLREARIMRKLQFVGIVRCFGITISSEATMVLLEFVTGGSIDKYLRKNSVTINLKTKLLLSCAEGVEFIHRHDVLHRDLAARNLLLVINEGLPCSVKICDFGLSQEKVKEYKLATAQQIPVRWSAPETLVNKVWSQKTDVWSFGVIMYEFFTDAAIPYFELEPLDANTLSNYLKEGGRLKPSKDVPPELAAIMTDVFSMNPNDRSDMKQIVLLLQNIVSNLK